MIHNITMILYCDIIAIVFHFCFFLLEHGEKYVRHITTNIIEIEYLFVISMVHPPYGRNGNAHLTSLQVISRSLSLSPNILTRYSR